MELLVGDTLTLNCTALVEFNAGVDIRWSYPGKEARSSKKKCFCHKKQLVFKVSVSSQQTNSCVETKPHREALSHATEAVSVLTIQSVNVTDTGPYVCNVTSTDTTLTQQTQVIVHGER